MKTRQAVLMEPRKMEIREVDLTPGPGQVLVKIAVCGLCNWEQNHWKGIIGKPPQQLGHEWSGTVAEVGKGVTQLKPGDMVTGLPDGLGAFADYMLTSAASCFKLDESVVLEHALGEPLKCIVTVMRAAAAESGDIGVVIGCGPMGLWCIQGIGGNLPAALIAVDFDPKKLEMAKRFGATHTVNPGTEDAAARISEISDGHMADFVIEGTGIPSVTADAVKYLKSTRGRIAMMSTHQEPSREFDWTPIHDKGAILMGTHPMFSLNEQDDMRRATFLINKGTFKMDGVISHKFKLEQIQEAFETCENKPADYIKGVVEP